VPLVEVKEELEVAAVQLSPQMSRAGMRQNSKLGEVAYFCADSIALRIYSGRHFVNIHSLFRKAI